MLHRWKALPSNVNENTSVCDDDLYSVVTSYVLKRPINPTNRNEYQELLKIKKPGGKMRPVRRADNLAAIYWPFV
jgi:hypothetical protein